MRARRFMALLLLLLVLGLVAVALWWRAARPGDPEVPRRFATAVAPVPALSTAQVPLTLSRAAVLDLLDQAVPQVFVEEDKRELEHGFVLSARIARAGELKLAPAQGALQITVPVDVHIEVTPPLAKKPATVDASLEVTGTVRLSITDAWALRTRTSITYSWVEEPTLKAGPVELPLRRALEARLDEQMPLIAARVDQRIEDRDPLRARVEQAWTGLQTPLDLGARAEASEALPGGEVWLVVVPEALLAGDPVFDARGLHLDVGLRGRFSLLVGVSPEAGPRRPLPSRGDPDEERRFQLQVPIRLEWDRLSALASARIQGQPQRLSVPGTDAELLLTLSAIQLYPSGERVVAALDYALDGPSTPLDGRGRLYLSGVPEVDRVAATLRLRDLAAAVDTDVTAVAAAAWLGQSGALEQLEDRLVVPLAEQLDAARAQIGAALVSAEDRPARLRGEVERLTVEAAVPTERSLVVVLSAEGTLSVTLTELENAHIATPPPRGLKLKAPGGDSKKPGRRGKRDDR